MNLKFLKILLFNVKYNNVGTYEIQVTVNNIFV